MLVARAWYARTTFCRLILSRLADGDGVPQRGALWPIMAQPPQYCVNPLATSRQVFQRVKRKVRTPWNICAVRWDASREQLESPMRKFNLHRGGVPDRRACRGRRTARRAIDRVLVAGRVYRRPGRRRARRPGASTWLRGIASTGATAKCAATAARPSPCARRARTARGSRGPVRAADLVSRQERSTANLAPLAGAIFCRARAVRLLQLAR